MTKKQVFKYICYAALLCSVPAGWATTVWADDAATPAQTPSSTPTLPTEYRTDFDVFDDQTMERSDWSNGSVFNCRWVPENTVVKDGFLTLTIDSNGNGGYNAGEWRTRQFFGYGRYEVRMKAIKNPGVVTSFFTYTGPSDNNPWDEVDIEVLGKDTTKVQFNYFTNGQGEHEYIHELGFDAAEDFHTYAFDWQKDKITWYVDGQEVYSATENIPVTPGKIMMNAWPGIGVDDWLQAYDGKVPLTATYDWMSYKATTDTDPADKPNEEPKNPDNPADKPSDEPKDTDKPKPEDPPGNVPTDTEQPNGSPNLNKQAPEDTNSTPKTTNTAKVLPNQHASNKLPATGDSKHPLLQIFGYVLFIGSILMMLLKPKKTSQND